MPVDWKQEKSTEEPPWLARARKELGVKEVKGAAHCPRILEYFRATKTHAEADEVPWCSAFVCWCFESVGIRSTRSARAASWTTWGRETYPEPGCVVVFKKTDPDAGGSGHVAFLVGVDGADLLVLGGNQGNKVSIARRPASSAVAYRWPVL